MSNSTSSKHPQAQGSAAPPGPDPKAERERNCETISDANPGGFNNDPNDPTSPNEAVERSRRTLRPSAPDKALRNDKK